MAVVSNVEHENYGLQLRNATTNCRQVFLTCEPGGCPRFPGIATHVHYRTFMYKIHNPSSFAEWAIHTHQREPSLAESACRVQQLLVAAVLCTREVAKHPSEALLIEVLRQMNGSYLSSLNTVQAERGA